MREIQKTYLREINYLVAEGYGKTFYQFNAYYEDDGTLYFLMNDTKVLKLRVRKLSMAKKGEGSILITGSLNRAKKFYGLPTTANITWYKDYSGSVN